MVLKNAVSLLDNWQRFFVAMHRAKNAHKFAAYSAALSGRYGVIESRKR